VAREHGEADDVRPEEVAGEVVALQLQVREHRVDRHGLEKVAERTGEAVVAELERAQEGHAAELGGQLTLQAARARVLLAC
jgi:hypothetical protein